MRKALNCARQNHNRIRRAEVAPGVSARPSHDNFEATAAQRFRDNSVRAGAVEHEIVADSFLPARDRKNVAHTPQVALTFFPHVPDEQKWLCMANARCSQHASDGQQRGDSRTIIGNSGTVKPRSLLANIQRRSRRKDSINMRADRNIVLSSSWTNAEDIAHVVAVNILKPKVNKSLCQPIPARPFPKWWRRNACHLQLPRRELRFLQAKPGKRVANFGQSCKPGDLLLQCG